MRIYVVMANEIHRVYRCDGDGDARIVGVFKDFNEALDAAKAAFEECKKSIDHWTGFEYEFSDEDFNIEDGDDELEVFAEDDGIGAFAIEIVIKKFDI